MNRLKHPNLILGIISILLLFIGVGLKANGYRSSDYFFIAGAALGCIHWIWAITDVFKTTDMGGQSRKFWIMIVIIVPAFGSIFYYLMRTRHLKI